MGARLERLPVLAMGMLALLSGLAVGLVRLGWTLPLAQRHADHLEIHGPLMVCGFLGTVIGLERAVALGRAWTYATPLLAALGVLALAVDPAGAESASLMTAAGVALLLVYAAVLRRQASLFTVTMALGALLWLVGSVLWLERWPIHRIVLLWAGFPVLTIAGERLELTRFLRPSALGRASFLVILGALIAASVAAVVAPEAARRLAGLGLLCLAAWLGRYDVARRTVWQHGLTRFMAVCLLTGYAWLGIAGALALGAPGEFTGPVYDATLHALFVGFVFAMVFGHAPVIFPAVLGASMAFRPRFYVHLALLHASLALRVFGDLDLAWLDGAWGAARRWGGLLNAVAVVAFIANTVSSLRFAARSPAPQGPAVASDVGPARQGSGDEEQAGPLRKRS